jgi:alkanesulfonate monooxygenase SsuD/methylene tetrahydromethanopterin reductase-like flavin-dependent oxidoreductase (luciferase family)
VQLGIFMEEARPGVDQANVFRETLQLADAAEAWGLDGVWLGELHFSPARSVLSAPLVVASAVATRTRRIRVGTAVQVLPLNHPLRIAEEVATLDHLSGGRIDFGIGRSGAVSAYDVFGIPYEESQARFEEALAIIVAAWTGEPLRHTGRFYRVDGATVCPRPYQVPHPPLRMAATSEETFLRVGAMGLAIWVGLRTMDIFELETHLAAYRRAWREAGHAGEGSVALRIPVYAAPTVSDALEEPRESIMYFFGRQAEFALAVARRAGAQGGERSRAQAERLAALSYDEILRSRVVFGTAGSVTGRLRELRDRLGLDCIAVELNPGGLIPAELVRRTLHILAHEVKPALD